MQSITTDGGFRSRKLWLAIFCIGVISVGYGVAGVWATLAAVYGEFVMGVLAAAGIYSGSNVVAKHLFMKAAKKVKKKVAAPPADPPVEPAPQ
jgi:hypothetical protein